MPTSHRALAAGLCAVSGLAVIFAMGAQLRISDLNIILPAACGALIGGAICADLFGLPGRFGLALTAIGAVLATLIGSALAGAAYGIWEGPTLIGIIYGPATVGHAILTTPAVLLAWAATMAGAHLAMRTRPIRPLMPS
ncbi:hypothetical protein [Tabrizicola sp.]|uniref:hypothetical protein n=1 Tax=Tabrizicola sp. TaxID=2005166 RepID=UPI003F39BE37